MALGVGPSAGNAIASQARAKAPAKPAPSSVGGFLSNVINTGIDIMNSPSRRKSFIEGVGKTFDQSPLGTNINSVVRLVQDPVGTIGKAFNVGNAPSSPSKSFNSDLMAKSPLNPLNRSGAASFFSKGPSINPPSLGGFKGQRVPKSPSTPMKVTPR